MRSLTLEAVWGIVMYNITYVRRINSLQHVSFLHLRTSNNTDHAESNSRHNALELS